MTDETRESSRCAVCGEGLSATEASVGVPDLLIEMHEGCYRVSLSSISPKVLE